MTAINSVTAGAARTAAADNPNAKPLGQADFLLLMTTQMKNQDPTKPMDSSAMLSQLAQFSTVQGIDSLNSAMGSMASVMESDQTLRAAQLVGHEAYVEASSFNHVPGRPLKGEIQAERAGPLVVDIVDGAGNRIARRTVHADGPGLVPFEWDGKDDGGEPVAAGAYNITAAADAGTSATKLATRLAARIESVSIEDYILTINIPALGKFAMSDIRRLA